MNGRMTFLHRVCLTLAGVFILALAPGLSGVPPENASARDEGQVKSATSRLITSPVNQVGQQIRNQGGVAASATILFRWLPAQVGSYPAGTSGENTADLIIPGAPAAGQPLWLGIYIANWGPNSPATDGKLRNYVAQMDASSLPAGLAPWRPKCQDDDDPNNDPDAADDACFALMGTGIGAGCDVPPFDNDECAPAFQDFSRADAQTWGFPGCSIGTDDLRCGGGIGAEPSHVDPGTEVYGGTFVLLAEQSLVGGPHSIEFFAPGHDVFMNDGATTVKVNTATLTISTVPSLLLAADDGLGADYNRVGDFKMPASAAAGGEEVTIRVTLNRMYIEDDPNTIPIEGCPVRHQGLTDLSVFEGQVRYLGPPEVFDNNALSEPKWVGAKLQCAPLVRDWSASALAAELGISQAEADTIYYYGAEVVPCSIHDVQQATQSCLDSANEDCFSGPLEVRTNLWGDLWPALGNVNFTDIGKVVDAFKSIPFVTGDPPSGAPNKWRSMLRENSPPFNKTINFTDIGRTRDGFHTIGYMELGPVEICDDGIDNNCNGVIDEDGALCEGCQFGGTRCECSAGVCVNTLISRTFRAP